MSSEYTEDILVQKITPDYLEKVLDWTGGTWGQRC